MFIGTYSHVYMVSTITIATLWSVANALYMHMQVSKAFSLSLSNYVTVVLSVTITIIAISLWFHTLH